MIGLGLHNFAVKPFLFETVPSTCEVYIAGILGKPPVFFFGMVLIYLNSVSQQYIVQLGKIRMT